MTNFSTPNPGDLVAVSNLTQVFGPINDLETGAAHWAGTTSGSVNAYTASLVNAPSSLTAGLSINLKIHASNTGASTLNLNGLGAVSIRLLNSTLTGGELVVNASYKLIYDGTYFQVVGAGTSGGSVALADITDWPAGVSATEVGYLDGVSSSLQTQLNGKASSSHNHVPPSSGSDGNVTISGSVTLTRDMYYNNLTLASGGVLDPAQYQIFVAGTLNQTGGKISANGTVGGNASAATGGTGGAGRSVGTLGLSGAGANGASGGTGAGATGSASVGASVQSWGGRGGAQPSGGAGGTGSGGSGGPAGAPLGFTHVSPRERIEMSPRVDLEVSNFVRGASGGGGGGAGGGDGVNTARGAGGGGGGAGITLVFVNILDLSGATGVLIESIGGAGGNAASGATGNCGGSGGGQGGGGGYVGLYCNSVTGSLANAIDVSGGAGGNGSNGAGTGTGGRGGRGGDGGNADFYRADTNTWTRARSAGAASGTAATAPSGVTGTTGGAGEVVRLSI